MSSFVTKQYKDNKKEKAGPPKMHLADANSTDAQSRIMAALRVAFKDDPEVVRTDPTETDAIKYNTGILSLDRALGVGGLLGGRIIDTFGEQGTGKTLLQMTIGGAIQRQGGIVGFCDAEGTFSPKFARACGLDPSKNFIYVRSTSQHIMTGEDFFESMRVMTSNGAHYIITDSVPALVPAQKFTTQFGEGQQATHARLMAEEVQKLNGYLTGSPRTLVAFINQIRGKPNAGRFEPSEEQTGGNALKFYRSYAFEMRKSKDLIAKCRYADGTIEERIIGVAVKLSIKKNKTSAKPTSDIEFNMFTEFATLADGTQIQPGVDIYRDVFEVGKKTGAIEQKGAWYQFEDLRGQGEDDFVQGLRDNPAAMQKIRDIVLSEGVVEDVAEDTTQGSTPSES